MTAGTYLYGTGNPEYRGEQIQGLRQSVNRDTKILRACVDRVDCEVLRPPCPTARSRQAVIILEQCVYIMKAKPSSGCASLTGPALRDKGQGLSAFSERLPLSW